MTISDETLMAYVDGELSAEERMRLAALIEQDAQLQARVARQERVHEALRAAFDPALRQPVPERLEKAAMTTAPSLRWRAAQGVKQFLAGIELRALPSSAVLASTLLLGVAIGLLFTLFQGGSGLVRSDGRALIAQGALAEALSQRLATDNSAAGPRVGVTFRSRNGHVCRTFETGSTTDNLAGIACREPGGWAVTTLTRIAPATQQHYELAGAGMPAVVRGALGEMIEGEPFDAAEERRAREAGWR